MFYTATDVCRVFTEDAIGKKPIMSNLCTSVKCKKKSRLKRYILTDHDFFFFIVEEMKLQISI